LISDPWFYAVAIPAVLVFAIAKGGLGGEIGHILHHRVSDRFFFRLMYVLLFVVGLKLIYDGLSP